jgi:uncharacterized 2Fe-2S/4Fe-4S cluster protein (DUF4445 family)
MNPPAYALRLSPAGISLHIPAGTRLQDVLFAQGVEFPCGGRGRCKGCRVRVLRGELAITPEEQNLLSPDERRAGWRLACRHTMQGELELELAQWEMSVLADESRFAFVPQEGLGVAIDLGTTTIAAQLLDLTTGHVLAVRTALNAQARHGADIMSRLEFALHGGQAELQRLVREQLGQIVRDLLAARAPARCGSGRAGATQSAPAPEAAPLKRIVLVGNTVMHHLFCGIPVAPLCAYPFESPELGRQRLSARALGWELPEETVIEFLPCLGGFVGSDILAGIVATGLHESSELSALMDLGTNGEVVVGHRERILCCSTAAGPAFEGARISMGMRAATGAISAVQVEDNYLRCHVIGGGEPRGICGSGLVDAVAAGLELEWIHPSGRLANRSELPLAGSVVLRAADVRELQLAKGAIAAGLRILAQRLGATLEDIRVLQLAGAFGNYINRASARRIGLLRLPLERIRPAGNTALLGAKRALFEDAAAWDALARRVEHVSLNEDPNFEEIFAAEMRFPSVG